MERNVLHVNMFGTFSLTYGENQITSVSNRSKLIWNILAYMICHRGELVATEDLISAVGDSPKNANPAGAMRTAIFRARQMLNDLTGDEDCKLLLSQNGGYMWNPEIPVVLDIDRFEQIVNQLDDSENETELCLEALSLYRGKFLSMQSSEFWVMPMQAYYQNLSDNLLDRVIPLLEKEGRHAEGIQICRNALQIEAFSEKTYQYLMRFLLMADQRDEVIKVYEDMSKLLLSTFGIMPDQESRALYREALFAVQSSQTVPPEFAIEQLKEQEEVKGTLVCDYDFFKILYQANARAILRSGAAVHTAVLTLKSKKNKDVSQNSLNIAMDNLEKHMSGLLRKGDVITRCSGSQFIVMLLSADYENSVKVCQRFVSSFEKKYPHSPVYIDCFVQAITPSV